MLQNGGLEEHRVNLSKLLLGCILNSISCLQGLKGYIRKKKIKSLVERTFVIIAVIYS